MSERHRTALSVSALVIAVLGWTPLGEAAKNAAFPPDSVGTLQLKANAVTSPKLNNGSVTGLDVQKRTLENSHVKPGSLLSSSFKPGQIPAGPQGARGEKGDKGAKGDAGSTNVVIRRGTVFRLSTGSLANFAANCAAGERALGGGVGPTDGSANPALTVANSQPRPLASGAVPTGWVVGVRVGTVSVGLDVAAYVICASP